MSVQADQKPVVHRDWPAGGNISLGTRAIARMGRFRLSKSGENCERFAAKTIHQMPLALRAQHRSAFVPFLRSGLALLPGPAVGEIHSFASFYQRKAWAEQSENKRHAEDFFPIFSMAHAFNIWLDICIRTERAGLRSMRNKRLYWMVYQDDFRNDFMFSVSLLRQVDDNPTDGGAVECLLPTFYLTVG